MSDPALSTDAVDVSPIDALCREIDERIGPRRVYPISFSIPAHLVRDAVPQKSQDFAGGTSRGRRAYKYDTNQQQAYYDDYAASYFGLTYRKGGWDCMRHLETMANGCLPYFPGGADIPRYTMGHYPKDIIVQAMSLAGNVGVDRYDLVRRDPGKPLIEDVSAYNELVGRMLDQLREHATTRAIADYLLRQMGKPAAKNVLFLASGTKTDYLCDLLFHGLRERLGAGCVDANKLAWMYRSYPAERRGDLYGNGFTYAGHLEDVEIDRADIARRIAQRSFDLVVFGSVTRCNDLLPLVREHYAHDEVALVDGEDYLRQTGTTKATRAKMSWKVARRYKPIDLAYQGVYFKRELDDALLIDFAAKAPASP
ncbi:MAG: hypothetical protein AAGH88_13950 [Planctomycetota bacterium]